MTRAFAASLIIAAIIALVTGGWDSWLLASLLAMVPLFVLLILLATRAGREALWARPLPIVPAALFLIAMSEAALQLVSFPPGLAHSAWGLLGDFRRAPITMDVHATRIELGKLAGLAAAFLVGVTAGRDSRNVSALITLALGAGLAFALVLIVERGLTIAGVTQRLASELASPNIAATILGSLGLMAIASIVRTSKMSGEAEFLGFLPPMDKRTGLALVTLAVSLSALALTASRGGVAATLIGIAVFFVLELAGRYRSPPPVPVPGAGLRGAVTWLVVAIVSALAVIMYGELLFSRLATVDLLGHGRATIAAAHFRAFLQAPWLGHGFGSFESINNLYMPREDAKILATVGAAHNVYLQWLEEAGLIGAAAMFASVAIIIWDIATGLTQRQHNRTWLRLALALCALVAAHSYVEFTLNVYAAALLCAVFLGLFWSLARR